MRRNRQHILLISLALCCCTSRAQESPRVASVSDLSRNPLKFDGRLIGVRAWLEFGWEGDNFLHDRLDTSHRNTPVQPRPDVWLHCDPVHNRQVYGVIKGRHEFQPVLATFTGYFHFIPNKKSRMKDVFDPGPLQWRQSEFPM